MSRRFYVLLSVVVVVIAAANLIPRGRHSRRPATLPAAVMRQEPLVMLWAWETPEDMTALDAKQAGVAVLVREVRLDHDVTVRPRYQPMHASPMAWIMAVVRMEAAPGFAPSATLARRAALAIAEGAQMPQVRAIQVDFDATASQRDFYAAVLRKLRQDLPSGFPVSITALGSWCGTDSWLRGLPIDEAVPMLFRMGGPRSIRAGAARSQSAIAEPLCSGAVGLSTDEAWPAVRPNQRVYMFHPGSWTKDDVARVDRFGYEGLRGAGSP